MSATVKNTNSKITKEGKIRNYLEKEFSKLKNKNRKLTVKSFQTHLKQEGGPFSPSTILEMLDSENIITTYPYIQKIKSNWKKEKIRDFKESKLTVSELINQNKELKAKIKELEKNQIPKKFSWLKYGYREIASDLSHYLFSMAYNLHVKNETNQALFLYKLLLKFEPDSDVAHHNIGIIYDNKGMRNKANEHYMEAMKINPRDLSYVKRMATQINEKEGVYATIGYFNGILKQNPNEELFFEIGNLYEKQKKWNNALKAYKDATRQNSNYLKAYLASAEIYCHTLLSYEKAIESLDEILKIKQDHIEALELKSTSLFGLGRFEEEERVLKKLVKLEPGHGYNHYSLAINFVHQRKTKEALKFLEKSFHIDKTLVVEAEEDDIFDTIRKDRSFITLIQNYSDDKQNSIKKLKKGAYT